MREERTGGHVGTKRTEGQRWQNKKAQIGKKGEEHCFCAPCIGRCPLVRKWPMATHTHLSPAHTPFRVRDHTHCLHNQSMDSFGRRDRPLSYSSHNISLQINPHSKWQGELDDSLPGNFVHNYFLSMGASHIHRRLNLNAQCLTKTFPPAICSVKQIN